jgi:hypothetical protein
MTLRPILLILLPIAACSREAAKEPARAQTATPAIEQASLPPGDSLLAALERTVTGFGHSRDSIITTLGTPLSSAAIAANGPEDQLDTLITLQYPGLEIILRKSGDDHREYFSNIRALDTTFILPAPLRLFHTPRSDIHRLLGEPSDVQQFGDSTVVGYESPSGIVIQFYCLAGILVRIRWVFELG